MKPRFITWESNKFKRLNKRDIAEEHRCVFACLKARIPFEEIREIGLNMDQVLR